MSPTGFRPGPGDTKQDQYTVTVQKVITHQRCPPTAGRYSLRCMTSEWRYTHTLVELASLATSDEAFAVWIPGHAGQTVFVRLAHLCAQLPRLQRDSELIGVIITNTPLYVSQ